MKLKYDDETHAYWLDGTRCKSVTTVAKIPDDTFSLDQWRKRMVALGMAREPHLIELAAAHHDDKQQLNVIAEAATKAARAHEAAERGTAMHRVLERHMRGEDILETENTRAIVRAWDRTLEGAGLEVVPEYVERIVVHATPKICGKFDCLLYDRRKKSLVVADLKTGASAVRYPHAIAIQLAMYANAQHLAERLPPQGGTTEKFTPLPEVNLKYGLVVHMPDEANVEVHKIDIAAGWEAAQRLCFPTLKWRRRSDLIKPHLSTVVSEPEVMASEERVHWIRGRIQLLGMVDGARPLVRARWPEGTPPKGPWTDAQVDALAEMCSTVERSCEASFAERDPDLARP